MPYYISHPQHGNHVCYTPEDFKAHAAVGWVLREGMAQDAKTETKPPEPKRRGRKPKAE